MDKRKGSDPIPYNIKDYLNDTQQYELKRLEAFGWSLNCVRRPQGEAYTLVMTNNNQTEWATLDEDGILVRDEELTMRNSPEINDSPEKPADTAADLSRAEMTARFSEEDAEEIIEMSSYESASFTRTAAKPPPADTRAETAPAQNAESKPSPVDEFDDSGLPSSQDIVSKASTATSAKTAPVSKKRRATTPAADAKCHARANGKTFVVPGKKHLV